MYAIKYMTVHLLTGFCVLTIILTSSFLQQFSFFFKYSYLLILQ